MSAPIVINIQLTGDAKSAIAAIRQVEKQLKQVSTAGVKANAAVSTGVNAGAINKTAGALKKASSGLREYTTGAKLAGTHGEFLTRAWAGNSDVIDKRYLKSVRGLRDALYRFNLEAENTLVIHKGTLKSLNDSSMAFERYMLKGNLVTRTLDNMSKSLINMGKNAQWTGRQMMVGITRPLLVIGSVAVYSAIEVGKLDRQLSRLWNGSAQGLAQLDQQSKDLSATWGMARTEIKEIQTIFAQIGLTNIEGLTRATVQFASIGDVDTKTAAEMVRVLAQAGYSGRELEATLSRLDEISDETSISLAELSSSLPRVAVYAKQLGISIEESAALLAGFTQHGIDADEAANALRSGLNRLVPALAAVDGKGDVGASGRLKALQDSIELIRSEGGINISFRAPDGRMRTGLEMMQQLAMGVKSLNEQGKQEITQNVLRNLFGATQAQRGTALLESLMASMDETTASGQDLAKAMEIARKETDAALQRWGDQAAIFLGDPTTQLSGQIQRLITAGQELGKTLIPMLTGFLEKLNNALQRFTNMSEESKKSLVTFITALAMIGPIVYIAGQGMIMIGTIARGLVAPFKSFFNLVHKHKDTFQFTDEFQKGLHDLQEELRNTKDFDGFKKKVGELVDAQKASAATSALVGDALDAEAVAHGKNVAAINAEAAAQARLNAVKALGFRGADGNVSRDALAEIPDSIIQAPVVPEVDRDAIRNQIRERLIRQYAARRRRDFRVEARTTTEINPQAFGRTNDYASNLQELIEQTSLELESLEGDRLGRLAKELAAEEIGDVDRYTEAIRNRKATLEALKDRLDAFERDWGVPVPIKWNPNAADPLASFMEEFDAFQRSIDESSAGYKRGLRESFIRQKGSEISSGALSMEDIDALVEATYISRIRENPDVLNQFMEEAFKDAEIAMGRRAPRATLGRKDNRLETGKALMQFRERMMEGEITPLTGDMIREVRELIDAGPGLDELTAQEREILENLDKAFKQVQSEIAAGKKPKMSGVDSQIRSIVKDSASKIAVDIDKEDQALFKKLQDAVNRRFMSTSENVDNAVSKLDNLIEAGDLADDERRQLEVVRSLWERRKIQAETAMANINKAIGLGQVPLEEDLRSFAGAHTSLNRLAERTKKITGKSIYRRTKEFNIDEYLEAVRKSYPTPRWLAAGPNAEAPMPTGIGSVLSNRRARSYNRAFFEAVGQISREEHIDRGAQQLARMFGTAEPTGLRKLVENPWSMLEGLDESEMIRKHGHRAPGLFQQGKKNADKINKMLTAQNNKIKKAFIDDFVKNALRSHLEGESLIDFANRARLPAEIQKAIAGGLYGGMSSAKWTQYVKEVLGDAYSDEAAFVMNKFVEEMLVASDVDDRFIEPFRQRAAAIEQRLIGTGGGRGYTVDIERRGTPFQRGAGGVSAARARTQSMIDDLDNEISARKEALEEFQQYINGPYTQDIADAEQQLKRLQSDLITKRESFENAERFMQTGVFERKSDKEKLRITQQARAYREDYENTARDLAMLREELARMRAMPARIDVDTSEIKALEKQREKMSLFANTLGEVIDTDDDLEILERALGPSGQRIRGKGGKFKSLPNIGVLTGNLSPEMSSVLHNLIVQQSMDVDDARRAIARLMPNLTDEVAEVAAQRAAAVSKVILENRDMAEAIFGRELFAEIARNEREASFSRTKGIGRGQVNTLDPHTSIAGFVPEDETMAIDQIDANVVRTSKDLTNRQQAKIDDLLSGTLGDRIATAETRVLETRRALDAIEEQLALIDDEIADAIGDHKKDIRASKERHRRRLKRERDELLQIHSKAVDDLNDIMVSTTNIIATDTKASGLTGTPTKTYANYAEFIDDLERLAAERVDSGPQLDRLTEAEVQRQEEIRARRLAAAEAERQHRLRKARERTERNVRSGERRSVGQFVLGRSRRRFSAEEIELLDEMHRRDVAAGRAERRFSRRDIRRYANFREESQRIAFPLDFDFMDFEPEEDRIRRRRESIPGGRVSRRRRTMDRVLSVAENTVEKLRPKRGFKNTILDVAQWTMPLTPITKMGEATTGLVGKFQQLFKTGAGLTMFETMFGSMGTSMSGMVAATGPFLPIIIAIAAVVGILWKNFKKWYDTAKPGIDKLREAGKELINAVLDPIRGLFERLNGEGEDTGNMWDNIGKIIGEVATIIAKFLEKIMPVVKFVFDNIADSIYIIVQIVRAVVALVTGDWSDFANAIRSIWEAVWGAIKRIAGEGLRAVVGIIADLLRTMIDGMAAAGNAARKFVAFLNPLGGAGPLENVDKWKEDAKGFITDMEGYADRWINSWANPSRNRKVGEEMRKEVQKGVSGKPLEAPIMDPEQARAQVEDFVSKFKDALRNVVDGWKEAAMDAFDDWAKSQEEAVDERIRAIDKEIEAERKRDQDLEYLRRKEELRNKRRSEQIRYQTDRDLAIYEGRYDDAKQLDYDYSQTLAELQRDEEELERDRQRTLTDRLRDAQKERLELEKEELVKSLEIRRQQMQAELDMMTEYLPRNVAAAQAMQEAIHAKMREYTEGYGQIAAEQASNWAANWNTAINTAEKQLAEEAYWAGTEAMKQFAAGLGIDPATLNVTRTESEVASDIARKSTIYVRGGATQAQLDEFNRRYGIYHAGGPVGNTAMGPYDVPATLQTGEYVIRRSAVAKYGLQKMEQINKGQAVFHEGGYVGMAYAAMSNVFNRVKDAFMGGARIGMARDESGNFFGGFTAEEYKSALFQAAGSFAGAIMGAVEGLHPEFLRRFLAWNAELGGKFRIGSGYRSFAEQQRLYDRWLRRVPGQAQAAPPGRSNHNWGLAIDLVPSRTTAAERALGAKYGLRWPMSFEPWHVEPVEAKQWRDAMSRGQYIPESEMVGDRFFKLRSDLFSPGGATGGDAKGIVKSLMGQYGWGNDQWPALERLVQKESGWNPSAKNPKSTAVGLFQFLKSTWDNYITRKGGPGYWSQDIHWQAKGGLDYIAARYGSPAAALAFHNKNNWYHKGGLVFDIPSLDVGGKIVRDGIAMVHANERVLNPAETAAFEAGGGTTELHLHFDGGFFGSDREITKLVDKINTEVIPKLNRAHGTAKRTFGKVTK